MKLSKFFKTAVLALFAVASVAFAQERGTATEAKALLAQGLAHVKAVGNDKAFADFTEEGKWKNKDLYVFVIKFDGITAAHGANKGLLGKSLIELKDPDGKFFIKEMIEIAKTKGSGTVDYSFTDPQTKKMGQKSSFIVLVPGYDGVMGVGVYKQ
jgi:cytochrome c